MTAPDATRAAIEAVFRIECARLVAGLTRRVGDLAVAEELAHNALVAALEQWPREGVPKNPAAWLMAAARHRAIDHVRRRALVDRKHAELRAAIDLSNAAPDLDAALDDDVGDDLLRLVFTCCHPVLPPPARVALTLRLLCGLTTEEIARAFLSSEPTIAQRIVRAKRALAEARVPFEVPRGPELLERLGSVLEVVYLVFNEGYAATAGDHWMRPGLCEDALRLGRIIAQLLPEEPEVHGLVALMEIQASRSRARVGPGGEPVLLLDQDRTRWDRLLIGRGLAALSRARALGGAHGPYVLQAAIAACHAEAPTADATDFIRIAALYQRLAQVMPSPVVELNRAVAVGMAFGPAAGLEIADALAAEPSLASYHLLPSVRGDLLAKLGRCAEAQAELERAASLTHNVQERTLLLRRAADVASTTTEPGAQPFRAAPRAAGVRVSRGRSTMNDTATIKQELHRIADEIRVRIHLAGMEAKDAWHRLEPKLREFERKAEAATDKLGDEVGKWGQELKEQAKRIRQQLDES